MTDASTIQTATVQIHAVTDTMPDSGVTVLACYRNSLGDSRTVRAEWVGKHRRAARDLEDLDDSDTDYDELTDEYYWPEGWYEKIDNWGDFSSVRIVEGTVTHWVDLSNVRAIFRELTGGAP